MLETWIVGFLGGVLLARVTPFVWAVDWATWPTLAGLAALALATGRLTVARRRRRLTLGWTLALAAFWGLGHAAPFPTAVTRDAVVVKTSVRDVVRGPVLIATDTGLLEVLGPQRPGASGSVSAPPGARLFGTSRGVLMARRVEVGPEDLWQAVRERIRATFSERMATLPLFYQRWLAGLVLGESAVLPQDVRDAFKRTGLYHLLVVSGLHVSLMALVLAAILRAPVQGAYALRLIGPERWRQAAAALDVLAAAAALLYLAVTGSSAAAQRSALLFGIWRGSAVFVGAVTPRERLLIAAALQALFFPVGFVGEGTLMSWAAYLLVLRPGKTSLRADGLEGLRAFLPGEALRCQLALTVLVTAVFGQLALIGLVANLVMIPAFPLLLVTGLLAMLAPGLPWTPLLLGIQRSFIALVRLFDGLCDLWPWLSIAPEALAMPVRYGAVVLSTWILLNRCRDLSISSEGPFALKICSARRRRHGEHSE